MKKLNLFLLLLCGMMIACSEPLQEIDNPVEVEDTEVSFTAYIAQYTRINGAPFEKDDAISVFAVEPSANIKLEASGNYADNVKYIYDGAKFVAGTKSISFDESNEEGLAYFAIYPYSDSMSSKFTFSTESDQSIYKNYVTSDLCTAYSEPTTDETVLLEFNHRLSNIIIKFQGENLANKKLSAEINDVYTSCDVDINANTYQAKGNRENIVMGEESGNTFHAIIVPQNVSSDDTFITVSMDGRNIPLSLSDYTKFESGKKYTFELDIEGNNIIILNLMISPWNSDWLNQRLYTSENYVDQGYHGYDSLFNDWEGLGVESIQYELFLTSSLSGASDTDIINSLKKSVSNEDINDINNGGITYFYSGLRSETSYTLCTYVTYKNGDTELLKSICSTKKAKQESENNFTQQLYTSKDYESKGYHDYDSLFYSWIGSSVKRVQYGLFTTESISKQSDNVIKEYLSNEIDSNGIDKINNGSATYVSSGLESKTSYTLCTLVTYEDDTTEFIKSTCSTEAVNNFTQQLYTSKDYESKGYHDYDSLFYSWIGSSVKRVQYGLFTTESISKQSDNVIKEYLSNEIDSNGIDKINNGSATYVSSGLESKTSYTLCTLVTYEDDTTEFIKSTCSTEAANKLSQKLFTSNNYENQGYHTYDSLFYEWIGESVKRVQYRLFLTKSLSNVSNDEIINNLSNEVNDEDIYNINNGGVLFASFGLESETNYTLCTLVTYDDDTTEFIKSTCSTDAHSDGKFTQQLYASNKYEHIGLHDYDSLIFTMRGTGVTSIICGLFQSVDIIEVSDDVIIRSLKHNVNSENIQKVNSGGFTNYYKNLQSSTYYTLYSFVTFEDGTQRLYKTQAKTADIPNRKEKEPDDDIPDTILDEITDNGGPVVIHGNTPPNIEGTYYIAPHVTIYCSDYGYGGYEPGHVISPYYFRFDNQDIMENTLSYHESSASGDAWSNSIKGSICGCDNKFTAWFVTEGEDGGIYFKQAITISGTKTSAGIKDLKTALIMIEKGYDPTPILMKEGAHRSFMDGDGLSEYTTRSNSVVYDENRLSTVSAIK